MFVFSPLLLLFLASVVLLDTTSVLGELGWKTYPINGVRRATFKFPPLSEHTAKCCINDFNYIDSKWVKWVQ